MLDAPGPLPEARALVVPRGSAAETAEALVSAAVVNQPLPFRLVAFLTQGEGALRAGEFAFPAHASLRTVLLVLRTAHPVQHRVTIPEGLTARQVAAVLDRADALTGDTPIPAEGSVLPETYAYEYGASRETVIDRARAALDRALRDAWAARAPDLPLVSAREALILASIVERETARPDERPHVAAVFLNRLRLGMKLQSDPTVIFGASGGAGSLDRPLGRADLDRDDPFNTYRIRGLPPAPICSPGLASLHAVLEPAAKRRPILRRRRIRRPRVLPHARGARAQRRPLAGRGRSARRAALIAPAPAGQRPTTIDKGRAAMDGSGGGARPTCVLVLQGGGALGPYHIGAYQALHEQRFAPDWVCGISIGAINAALIAGNAPERRLERLGAFWEAISWPELLPGVEALTAQRWLHTLSYAQALTWGQPGFFTPRPVNPYLASSGTGCDQLLRHRVRCMRPCGGSSISHLLNQAASTRLTMGATDIETGALVFFDNHDTPGDLGPEHVVASGSLPPGFPPTPVGNRLYWDGGCVSNTPLEAVLDHVPSGHTVVFAIDLWSASGPPPTTMDEVQGRAKQILYASRTAHHIDSVATKLNLRHAMRTLGKDAPASADPAQRMDLVHIIYRPSEDQITASDAEFSRSSLAKRQNAGYADMRRALDAAPWHRAQQPSQLGCMVHRVTPEAVTTLPEPNLGPDDGSAAAGAVAVAVGFRPSASRVRAERRSRRRRAPRGRSPGTRDASRPPGAHRSRPCP